jgi:uncharacterized RDD family membrane protein YckC
LWKQEVTRRLAAHNSRKGSSTAEPKALVESHLGAGSRAADAAARVAARYAKAPSYSDMLAGEARAAVRAEAVSRAALEAQAAAESVLAGLEAATLVEHPWEPEAFHGGASERALEQAWEASAEAARPAAASSSQTLERQSFGILWDADMPVREAEPAAFRATHGPGASQTAVEDWWEPASPAQDGQDALGGDESIEVVEPAQPIHANLIEFPRELVATRKVRPRLAEGPYAAVGDPVGQLSIFEVDPGSISTQPAAAEAVAAAAAPAWPGSDWSSIQLDEQSLEETAVEAAGAGAVRVAAALQQAPMGLRLMAVVVDGALILAAFLAAALVAMDKAKDLPNLHEIELGAAVTLVALAVLYQLFFFTLAAATPGMKWAHISLCTLGDEKPTRGQRCGRLGALVLSLLPVGLGVVWAIFDEEHLSWHDRLSGTYVRKR